MSMEVKYADVLAEVRRAVAKEERAYDVRRVANTVSGFLRLNFYPGRGAPTREGRRAETRFDTQVRRALDALADDGTLVKVTTGKSAQYLPPALREQQLAAFAKVNAERQAKTERVAAQRCRLAAFGIDARLQFGEIRLEPDQLDTLMDLAAKGLA